MHRSINRCRVILIFSQVVHADPSEIFGQGMVADIFTAIHPGGFYGDKRCKRFRHIDRTHGGTGLQPGGFVDMRPEIFFFL